MGPAWSPAWGPAWAPEHAPTQINQWPTFISSGIRKGFQPALDHPCHIAGPQVELHEEEKRLIAEQQAAERSF